MRRSTGHSARDAPRHGTQHTPAHSMRHTPGHGTRPAVAHRSRPAVAVRSRRAADHCFTGAAQTTDSRSRPSSVLTTLAAEGTLCAYAFNQTTPNPPRTAGDSRAGGVRHAPRDALAGGALGVRRRGAPDRPARGHQPRRHGRCHRHHRHLRRERLDRRPRRPDAAQHRRRHPPLPGHRPPGQAPDGRQAGRLQRRLRHQGERHRRRRRPGPRPVRADARRAGRGAGHREGDGGRRADPGVRQAGQEVGAGHHQDPAVARRAEGRCGVRRRGQGRHPGHRQVGRPRPDPADGEVLGRHLRRLGHPARGPAPHPPPSAERPAAAGHQDLRRQLRQAQRRVPQGPGQGGQGTPASPGRR